jgi:hypothetical protein
MQPYISPALAEIRIAEMRREAEAAGLARDVKRARRLWHGLARVRPARAAKPAWPERAGLGSA